MFGNSIDLDQLAFALESISNIIRSSSDKQEVFRIICQIAVETLKVEHSALIEFSSDYSFGKSVAEYPNRTTLAKPVFRTIDSIVPVSGVPLEEELIRSMQPIAISDIDAHLRNHPMDRPLCEILSGFGIKSVLFVPIIVDNRVIASFSLDAIEEKRDFRASEIELCKSLANLAAIAIQKERLRTEASDWNEITAKAIELTTTGELQSVLTYIAEQSKEVFRCDAITLYVYNKERQELNHPPILLGVTDPTGATRSGAVLTDSIVYQILNQPDQVYVANDVTRDRLFQGRRFAEVEKILSVITVQFRAVYEVVGLMFVNYRTLHAFTTDEIERVKSFAKISAVAIYNAQSIKSVQMEVVGFEAVTKAGQIISESLDQAKSLERIAEQACWIMSTQGITNSLASIRLIMINKDKLHRERRKAKLVAAYPNNLYDKIANKLLELEVRKPRSKDDKIGIMVCSILEEKTILLPDVTDQSNPYWKHYLSTDDDTKAAIAIPLRDRGEVVGVFNVECYIRNAFDEKQVRVLEALAGQASVAI